MSKTFHEQSRARLLTSLELPEFQKAQEAIQKAIKAKADYISSCKEEILTAFFAKYGFEPERAVMVEQKRKDGSWAWHVRRKTDEEMASNNIA